MGTLATDLIGNVSGVNQSLRITVQTSNLNTWCWFKGRSDANNFTLNRPLLITLFQIPLSLLRTSPWINIMWFRLEICTITRRSWFAPDTFPFNFSLFYFWLEEQKALSTVHPNLPVRLRPWKDRSWTNGRSETRPGRPPRAFGDLAVGRTSSLASSKAGRPNATKWAYVAEQQTFTRQ
jgi:hypothetical protein